MALSLRSYILAFTIILSAAFLRQAMNWFLQVFDRDMLIALVWVMMALGIAGLFWMNRRPNSVWRLLGLATIVGLGLLAAWFMQIPEERVHLLIYGILAFSMCYDYTHKMYSGLSWVLLALLLVSSADELFQYFLPYRVGDLRDVGFNMLGSLWGIGLFIFTSSPESQTS